ncbi:histidine phosphatase family protein [Stutzerimonas stutzeri]|uniref:histidine phosphatase family protein n=1 Tax=Stutzerimonas stutzeri TaxID=316 RepID=UPI003D0746A6
MRGIGLALVALLFVVGPLQADDGDAWQALREGRALLLLRHANAPGLGDPPGFVLDDCSTQRNLDEHGRAQARRWGELLREKGLTRVRLLSSRWCRALETAEQMALGPVEPLPALDSFFASPASEGRQTVELREVLAGLEPGEVAVLVSHQVNITALAGIFPQSGEGLILARPLAVPPQILARVPPP